MSLLCDYCKDDIFHSDLGVKEIIIDDGATIKVCVFCYPEYFIDCEKCEKPVHRSFHKYVIINNDCFREKNYFCKDCYEQHINIS